MRATRSMRSAAPPRRRPVLFADRLILRLYLWLVWHELPMCRVADRAVFGSMFRPRLLPSVSQFCKRIAEPRFAALLEAARRRLTGTLDGAMLLMIDGKALPVTENSRDPDATTGHGGGRFCKGYRLNAMTDDRGRIGEYRLSDMRQQEKNLAFEMLGAVGPGQVVLADGNYDSSRLYDRAAERGAFLFTPVKALGQHRVTIARTSPERREAGRVWRERPHLAAAAYALRGAIERTFANLSNFAGGLRGLPPWVRTRRRVERFVAAKLVIYAARRLARHPSAKA
ncbi:MAG: transposase [Phycisphaerales bacterium]